MIREKLFRFKGLCLMAALGCMPAAHAVNELGQAVQDLGGSRLLVNAADAIYVTCVGIATSDPATLSPDQQTLGGRCADMTQQGFQLAGNFYALVSAADTLGLATQADGGASYLGILRQFSGEEMSSQGRHATEGAFSQFKSLAGRLSAIRRGVRGSGFTFNMQGVDVIASADTTAQDLIGGAAGSADADTGFAWFANMEYGFGDRDDSDFENGYDADSFGGVLGLDYGFNENLVAGIAVNFNTTEIDFDDQRSGSFNSVTGGDMKVETKTLSLFLNWVSNRLFASAIVNFGQSEYDMERGAVLPLGSAGGVSGGLPAEAAILDSDTDADQFAVQVQVGYTFGEGSVTYDLYGGYDHANLEIDGFAETGSPLALSFDDQDIDSQQAFVGFAIRNAVNRDFGVLVPYASAEYRHEFDNDARVLGARYVGSTRARGELFQGETDNFEIPTNDPDDTFFDVTVGVAAQLGNNLALFGQFSSLVGLEDTSSSLITVGIRGSF